MKWDDGVRSPAELTSREVELTDDYPEAVEELLAAKTEHSEPRPVEGAAPGPAGRVVDLWPRSMRRLRRQRLNRGESTQGAVVHDLPKKRAAKTAATKIAATDKDDRHEDDWSQAALGIGQRLRGHRVETIT